MAFGIEHGEFLLQAWRGLLDRRGHDASVLQGHADALIDMQAGFASDGGRPLSDILRNTR